MPHRPPACLITRPEPGAAETAARVAALGWEAVQAPALLLAPRPTPLPAGQALVLASRAAARALAGRMPDMPVLAVGEATAAEARRSGAQDVRAAGGDAAALTALAAETLLPSAGPLLLAVGEGYGAELSAALRERGFRVTRRAVYSASPADTLPTEAQEALASGRVRAALFFSPRSATVAIRMLRSAECRAAATACDALALSARVASALNPMSWRSVRVAARPDQDALLALLGPPSHEGPPRP